MSIRISAILAVFVFCGLGSAEPKPVVEKKAPAAKPIPRTGPKKLFPVRVEAGGRTLHLNGWGLCEWGVFNWDLYYAALHCEQTSRSGSKLVKLDRGYQIHLHFLRELTRDQMRKAFRASAEANAGKKLPRYSKRLNQLLAWMRTVEKGDDLRFVYLPGRGTTVSFNGKLAGTIPGADWARFFLDLYVGSKPPTQALRKGLLGR
jgi:hypothetical protein